MDEQLAVILLGAGGGGAAILALVNGLIKWLSGASGRERQRNTDLSSQRNTAVADRDTADIKRREAEEHVSQLKRQLIEHGVTPLERQPTTREQ